MHIHTHAHTQAHTHTPLQARDLRVAPRAQGAELTLLTRTSAAFLAEGTSGSLGTRTPHGFTRWSVNSSSTFARLSHPLSRLTGWQTLSRCSRTRHTERQRLRAHSCPPSRTSSAPAVLAGCGRLGRGHGFDATRGHGGAAVGSCP